MAVEPSRSQGKSMFVKEVLNDNPRANAAIVNEAWRAAGMSGSISAGLVNNLRFRLGLSGNLRGRKRKGRRRGPSAVQGHGGANRNTTALSRRRSSELMDLEVEIDRLMMKVTEIGQLSDVEDSLRKARRQLFASLATRSGSQISK